MIYKDLADLLDSKLYITNYYEDEEDIIEYYSQKIIDTNNFGEYTLLGYSAGGILAYQVAENLEKKVSR